MDEDGKPGTSEAKLKEQPEVLLCIIGNTFPGVSDRVSFTATTSPDTGAYTSEAAFTDSTTPKVSPCTTKIPKNPKLQTPKPSMETLKLSRILAITEPQYPTE